MERVAVIGVGRLGLCLALNLERTGYDVTGVDVSQAYVDSLNDKSFRSPEPGVNALLTEAVNFTATTQLSEVISKTIRVLFLVLPTPSRPDGSFSHAYVNEVADQLAGFGKQTTTRYLVVNSTTMPGYCEELQKKIAGYNYEVVYNPEFIAQGSILHDQLHPDQVLIGEGVEDAGDMLESIYKKMCRSQPAFCRMSRTSAEITKLATNCFLTTKIAFANAIGDLSVKTGAEPEKILRAVGIDSRIGNKYFRYGFGYGGPCFPRDNRALNVFAGGNGYELLIGLATDKANQQHSDFLLEGYQDKYKPGETIIFDSVTYKKGTDILEESQQLGLALGLARAGRVVKIRESGGVIAQLKELYGDLFQYELNGQ